MHRHGYKGKKLSRTKDTRRLLVKNLASSLILQGRLTTTLPKAKVVLSYTERLITKAKKADLHNRRQIISKLTSRVAAHQLVDDLAPQLTNRQSGYLRLRKLNNRLGDNAWLAKIEFVDKITKRESSATRSVKPKPATPEAAAKKEDKDEKTQEL